LPKAILTGLTPITAAVPVPESVTGCGLPTPLSLIINVPTRLPAVAGRKVTLINVRLPGVIVIGNIPEAMIKSDAFTPVTVRPETTRLAVPELAISTLVAMLLVFTS